MGINELRIVFFMSKLEHEDEHNRKVGFHLLRAIAHGGSHVDQSWWRDCGW